MDDGGILQRRGDVRSVHRVFRGRRGRLVLQMELAPAFVGGKKDILFVVQLERHARKLNVLEHAGIEHGDFRGRAGRPVDGLQRRAAGKHLLRGHEARGKDCLRQRGATLEGRSPRAGRRGRRVARKVGLHEVLAAIERVVEALHVHQAAQVHRRQGRTTGEGFLEGGELGRLFGCRHHHLGQSLAVEEQAVGNQTAADEPRRALGYPGITQVHLRQRVVGRRNETGRAQSGLQLAELGIAPLARQHDFRGTLQGRRDVVRRHGNRLLRTGNQRARCHYNEGENSPKHISHNRLF